MVDRCGSRGARGRRKQGLPSGTSGMRERCGSSADGDTNVNCMPLLKKLPWAKDDQSKEKAGGKAAQTNTIEEIFAGEKVQFNEEFPSRNVGQETESRIKTPKNYGGKLRNHVDAIGGLPHAGKQTRGLARQIQVPAGKAVKAIGKYGHATIAVGFRGFVGVVESILVYGTELIVQLLALLTIAFVMTLKQLDSMLINRHLAAIISYMESIDVTRIRRPGFAFNFSSVMKITNRLIWIIIKMIMLLFFILKHILIQTVWGILFIISWAIYSVFQSFSRLILFPTVDRTMNALKLDPHAVSEITKLQFTRLSLSLSILSYELAPFLSDWLTAIGSIHFLVAKVRLLRHVVGNGVSAVRSMMKLAISIVQDVMAIIATFQFLGASVLNLVMMFISVISLLCYLIFTTTYTIRLFGFYINIFFSIILRSNRMFSRLQKS